MCKAVNRALIAFLLILLGGCAFRPASVQSVVTPQPAPSPVSEGTHVILPEPSSPPVAPVPEITSATGAATSTAVHKSVTPVAKKYDYNWDVALKTLAGDMQKNVVVDRDDTIFVGLIRNNTNGAIDLVQGRNKIIAALQHNGAYRVVSAAQSHAVRQTLGLQTSDTLSTAGKVTAVARQCKARYVVFPVMKGNVKSPVLKFKMMETHSGEICFTSRYPLHAVREL